MAEIHPTTPNMRRFLPEELHHTTWADLEDPTALEEGDWLFDPANHAHYAGKVVETNKYDCPLTEVVWYKSTDNIFNETLTHRQLARLWWADPMIN